MAENSLDQDIISFVAALDRCWLERRFDDIKFYLAEDVVFVAPNGQRAKGCDGAIASYREFMGRAQIRRYDSSEPVVTKTNSAAVVEYGWDMAWDSEGQSHQAKGREVLVLSRAGDSWSVIWRTQLSG